MKDKLSLDVNSAERMEDGESSKNGSERKKGIDPFSAQNLPKLLDLKLKSVCVCTCVAVSRI